MKTRWNFWLGILVAALVAVTAVFWLPAWWCGRAADDWFAGESTRQVGLARTVADWVERPLTRDHFGTGSAQFDGEWLFGTYMMAGMGFGQMALEHPEQRDWAVGAMKTCIDKILQPEVRAFDRERWGSDPIDSLDGTDDHAAYLGYFNLLLSFHRSLDPESRLAPLNDAITAALVRRMEASPILLLQSYPREVYPVDNAAVIASIALHGKATGQSRDDLVRRWADNCRERYVDRHTALLYQAVSEADGNPIDAPRGSGTWLAAYFLSFADRDLSAELSVAGSRQLSGQLLGFGMMREYPAGQVDGRGDIDSGPIVLGYGVSATGFALAACRVHGDAASYRQLYRTVHLFGAPLREKDRFQFVTGGPLGNAIMLAMLTAQPAGSDDDAQGGRR